MKRVLLKPTADPVFKRIFGQEKAITIEIINLLINPPNPVVELEYFPQELFPDLHDGKVSIVDVRCMDSKHQHFIIEMQLVHHVGFNQRALLYAAKAYGQQLKRGMLFDNVQSVYLLSIVNHQIKADPIKWLHHLAVIDRTDLDFEIPGINLIFLELAKRKKLGNFNFENPVDRWLSFLTEPEKILTMPKFDLSEYPNLMKAVELLDQSNYSEAQLYAYDKHLLAVADINQSRIENFDKGYEEGIEKGKEAGRLEGFNEGKDFTLAILKDLHHGKLSQKEIAEKYSISVEEVNDLSSALK